MNFFLKLQILIDIETEGISDSDVLDRKFDNISVLEFTFLEFLFRLLYVKQH